MTGYLDAKAAAAYIGRSYRAFDQLARSQGLQPDGYAGRARVYKPATLDRLLRMIRDRKRETGSVVPR